MNETVTRIKLPGPTGKFPVGLRHLSYPAAAETGPTLLSITVFYPAAREIGETAGYAFRQILEPLGLDKVDTACVQNAPFSSDGPFPLLIYNHGYLMYEMSNTVLCTELASCGFIVAAIGHTYEASVMLPDGSFIPKGQKYIDFVYEPRMLDLAEKLINEVSQVREGPGFEEELAALAAKFYAMHDGNLNESAIVWEEHTVKAAEFIDRMNRDYSSFLFGGVDLTVGVGLFGHSFGGAVAANCCRVHDLFTCGINIDGAQLGDSFGKDIGKPFMTISGNDGGRILLDLYRRNTEDSFRISIQNVEHIGFTDRGILGKLARKMYPGVGEKDPEQVCEILAYLHLSFFRKYLLGENIEIQEPDDADVTFQRKPGQEGGERSR